MTFDYSLELPEVITLLENEGLRKEASVIRECFEYSTVSTELLIDVRYYLLHLPTDKLADSTAFRVKRLISEIDKILAP